MSEYYGDIKLDDSLNMYFNTTDAEGAPVAPSAPFVAGDFEFFKDGAIATITGTPVVYATPQVGLHIITIDTSVDTDFTTASEWLVVVADGTVETVDGQVVDNIIIGSFSIENRTPASDAGALLTNVGLVSTGLDLVLVSSTFVAALIAGVWDRVLSGATHNIATSAGRRLRQVEASFVITSGTAQAGGAASITLASGESATNDIFQGDRVVITEGTGIGEHGIVTTYNGTTKVCTMSQNWVIQPDSSSVYELSPADVDIETWQHTAVTTSATSALPEVDTKSISDDTQAADNLEAMMDGILLITVNDASATTTAFATDGFTEATDNIFKGRLMTFLTGANQFEQTDITNYDASGGTQGSQEFTVTALTSAPANDVIAMVH